jgi:hypothetical protein
MAIATKPLAHHALGLSSIEIQHQMAPLRNLLQG